MCVREASRRLVTNTEMNFLPEFNVVVPTNFGDYLANKGRAAVTCIEKNCSKC